MDVKVVKKRIPLHQCHFQNLSYSIFAECSCNRSGTVGRIGSCNSKSGQCICKPSTSARRCDQCLDGWYNLADNNLFGCTDCDCDIGGSISNICNKVTGQCACLPLIEGRNCKEPINTYYFPTLHQHQFEIEDGRTPAYTPVRYGFDEKVFPGYSWKGYAVFSHLQVKQNCILLLFCK